MGLFGSKLDKLVEKRDLQGLWVRLRKKATEKDQFFSMADAALVDELWDHVSRRAAGEHREEAGEAVLFAASMHLRNFDYAGTHLVTPIEFLSRIGSKMFGDKPAPEAFCPVCNEYLSEAPIATDSHVFAVCGNCGRFTHRACAGSLQEPCKACGQPTTWEPVVRR